MTPDLAWTFGPPNSSLVIGLPNARSTRAGPPIMMLAFSAITEKWLATRRDAGRPATGPRPAVATGTSVITRATD